VSPALCGSTCGRWKEKLNVVYVYEVHTDADAFAEHTQNEPFKKFSEIMNSIIEDWTMVIPFSESVTSNLDE